MILEVRLFAYLRDGRGKKVYLDIIEGTTTIQDILDSLNISKEEASIVLMNGKDAPLSAVFREGDYLSLFPPVGGG